MTLKAAETVAESRKTPPAVSFGIDHAKAIPDAPADRVRIREAATERTRHLDRSRPLGDHDLLRHGAALLGDLGLDERYLAYALIMVNNGFWRDQFRAVPFSRRLLLLPRCLKHLHGTDGGGRADLGPILVRARQLGYRILVADGTPMIVKVLTEEEMDGVLGVACLDSLEAAFDRVRHLGVPSMAVPLLVGNCRNTTVELDQVAALLELHSDVPHPVTRSYLPLLRESHRLFEDGELTRLLGNGPPAGGAFGDLMAEVMTLARQWLERGGKRLRPFVTLAGYRALAADGAIPDSVCRTALAIEAFHKASLVHDDIEDDDATRYGAPTLHRQVGVDAAINVGDYLLGLGYRLIASAGATFGAAQAAALVRLMSDAHVRLAQGQGAELAWRTRTKRSGARGHGSGDNADARLSLSDVLRLYDLKTAPAFEAALASGLVLAGGSETHLAIVRRFARYVGVGFQVLNDLNDWRTDLERGRPTVLPILAPASGAAAALWRTHSYRDAQDAQDGRTQSAAMNDRHPPDLDAAERALEAEGVFRSAGDLVRRFRERAKRLAGEAQPPALADLLLFLVEIILPEPRDLSDRAPKGCNDVTPA
jgi:geranylgeranyl diphosphate synthase type II